MTISTMPTTGTPQPDDRLDQLVSTTSKWFSESRISLDMIEGKVDHLGERLEGVERRLTTLEAGQADIRGVLRAAQEAGKYAEH